MKEKHKELFIRYLNNQCSDEELLYVMELFKDPDAEKELFDSFGEALESTEPTLEITPQHSLAVWNKIRSDIDDTSGAARAAVSPPFYQPTVFRMAATLLLLIGVGGLIVWMTTHRAAAPNAIVATKTVDCPAGKKASITLPDGTVAHLNGNSRLVYPTVFASHVREVSLTGEAFFEVVKNKEKPFVIESDGVYTKVLGTSFNLRTYQHEVFELTLVTGKVEVSAENLTEPVILMPNEQVQYDRQQHHASTRHVNTSPYTAWKEGVLVLRGNLQEEAVKIGRWYNKTVIVDESAAHCTVDATYKKQPLYHVLEGLAFILHIEYEIKGDIVVIKGTKPGC